MCGKSHTTIHRDQKSRRAEIDIHPSTTAKWCPCDDQSISSFQRRAPNPTTEFTQIERRCPPVWKYISNFWIISMAYANGDIERSRNKHVQPVKIINHRKCGNIKEHTENEYKIKRVILRAYLGIDSIVVTTSLWPMPARPSSVGGVLSNATRSEESTRQQLTSPFTETGILEISGYVKPQPAYIL